MKIAIGNDHVAVALKKCIMAFLEEKGIEVINVGTDSEERFNYPISGYKVGKMVASGEVDYGILICGTGVGISLAANKIKGDSCLCMLRTLYRKALQDAQQQQYPCFRRACRGRRFG